MFISLSLSLSLSLFLSHYMHAIHYTHFLNGTITTNVKSRHDWLLQKCIACFCREYMQLYHDIMDATWTCTVPVLCVCVCVCVCVCTRKIYVTCYVEHLLKTINIFVTFVDCIMCCCYYHCCILFSLLCH